MNIEEQILELLWDYLKRDPEHKDRKRTGWGTKTKQGLIASIYRISKEHFNATAAESSAGPIQVFNDRELATVLHSLRHYQERHYGTAGGCVQADEDGLVCDHFDEAKPLTAEEIDALCERLNLAPAPEQQQGKDCVCGHTWYKHTNQIGHVGSEDTWGCEDCNCTGFDRGAAKGAPERPIATVFLNPSDSDKAYIHAAREMIAGGCHFDADDIEIDDNPLTSPGEDHGAWVAAWVWVSNSDADLCEECGGSLDDGEGFDGYCGSCADKREVQS